MEENTLAILDANESKDMRDVNDDRLSYLQAVRAVSLLPEKGAPPTRKMYDAVFQILRSGTNLELIMASFHLLKDLDKRFPRAYIPASTHPGSVDIQAFSEVWSPFNFSLDTGSVGKGRPGNESTVLFDTSAFHQLIQDLSEATDQTKLELSHIKILQNMLVFQYLVSVLEADFASRNNTFPNNLVWNFVRESLVNLLLTLKRTNYKALVKDCVSTLCQLYNACSMLKHHPQSKCYDERLLTDQDYAVEIGLPEVRRSTCFAITRLLIVIMELDASKKKADSDGLTTRADGTRTPLLEMVVDELTYNRVFVSPFLQALDDPKWKLEIVLQCFSKYISRPSVRTRRSDDPAADDSTLNGILRSCFSSCKNARNVVKKMGTDFVQLLLSHAFQAQLTACSGQKADKQGLTEMRDAIISSFISLRNIDAFARNMEIVSFAREAIFAAATISSKGASEM